MTHFDNHPSLTEEAWTLVREGLPVPTYFGGIGYRADRTVKAFVGRDTELHKRYCRECSTRYEFSWKRRHFYQCKDQCPGQLRIAQSQPAPPEPQWSFKECVQFVVSMAMVVLII